MSENPILISNLNDFIFCPVSIYFHSLDAEDVMLTQSEDQLNGSKAHEKVDSAEYSLKKTILQAVSVYCEKYGLIGKIDVFDCDKHILTERKKKITTIYDGYVFQLYAQYFALIEMGYMVDQIKLYSMDDNKSYDIALPENDSEMLKKFEKLMGDMKSFSFDTFTQKNVSKCEKCIYEQLCSFSLLKGDVKSVYRT